MITIAGVKVANPADVKIGRFDLTKSGRVATGKMVMDVIRAGVRRVDVSWSYLTDDELKTILDVLAANKPFFSFRYLDAGGPQTMTAYAGDIVTGIWHEVNGIRHWKEVSIAFIEQ